MMRRAVKTRKIDYDTAVSLFKRQFDELKKSIEKTGLASDWVDNKPMITDKTNFIPAVQWKVWEVNANAFKDSS